MKTTKCQCCGNYVFTLNGCGKEANGEPNLDYCSSCYKSGYFFTKDSPEVHDLFPIKRLFTDNKVYVYFGEHEGHKQFIMNAMNRLRGFIKNLPTRNAVKRLALNARTFLML